MPAPFRGGVPPSTTRQLRRGATSPSRSRSSATHFTLSTTFNEAFALVMSPKPKADIDESEEDSKVFDWDGSPLTRYPWAKHLAKRCFKHDARFRQHVQFGYHMSGHKTIVQLSITRKISTTATSPALRGPTLRVFTTGNTTVALLRPAPSLTARARTTRSRFTTANRSTSTSSSSFSPPSPTSRSVRTWNCL